MYSPLDSGCRRPVLDKKRLVRIHDQPTSPNPITADDPDWNKAGKRCSVNPNYETVPDKLKPGKKMIEREAPSHTQELAPADYRESDRMKNSRRFESTGYNILAPPAGCAASPSKEVREPAVKKDSGNIITGNCDEEPHRRGRTHLSNGASSCPFATNYEHAR
eukprot:NODE_5687_length_625_cov_11.582329_g5523_i0.p1 GENE.NODE_5687_length_625_cov_11.582329_g5523_i0~~NODE_5687_length_625_cov_11.582329_g5523_i0.p1  ORF type:complete len:163 (-),score=38.42 NODE_5687_length_625_cov_11.582329_g5523_i0:67-555(-)